MDNRALEGLEPQKIQEQAVPESLPQAPVVTPTGLTPEQIADLQHKAEVSSQNFERAKKAELALKEKEQELELLTNQSTPTEAFSDEGKLLEKKITELSSTITELKQNSAKEEVLRVNPILKDKWTEFETFRQDPENKGMNLKTAAKAFLTETGLLEVRRQGLEQNTGGDRTPMKTGMSPEEAEELRVKNFRLYQEKLQRGEIPNS